MSILFRRRIKIIPGVRLNISKSGLSASVGVRGASVTLGGKGGTYANLGIPGTGIYTRKKLEAAIKFLIKKIIRKIFFKKRLLEFYWWL